MEIRPQRGAQEEFLASDADVVLYSGAAGAGKSWCLLLDPLRYVGLKGFYAVLFRRTYPEIKNPGGLWDESWKVYPYANAEARAIDYAWEWGTGSKVKMSHMEHDKDRYSHQGAQYAWIGFDELTHFSREAFLYMFSRNRTMCGMKPKIRATTNPDSESWVREMIDWWVKEDGLIDRERAKKVKWFTIENDKFVWSDEPREGYKSFQLIPATLSDNQKLLDADPGYVNNLKALPLVERERLLNGNWNISNKGGIFKKEWLEGVYSGGKPPYLMILQSWDTAFKASELNDPSACVTLGVHEGGVDVLHVLNERMEYPTLKARVVEHAKTWQADEVLIEDKASGQSLIQDLRTTTMLPIKAMMPTADKITRASSTSIFFENGKVFFPEFATWKSDIIAQLLAFPKGKHDDVVDAFSMAFARLAYVDFKEMAKQKMLEYEDDVDEIMEVGYSGRSSISGY